MELAPRIFLDLAPREKRNENKTKKETKNEKLGITTLTLSNGATVKYKKTDFKNDEVLFQAQSYGGNSLISTEDYLAVNLALSGVTEAGLAGLNKND